MDVLNYAGRARIIETSSLREAERADPKALLPTFLQDVEKGSRANPGSLLLHFAKGSLVLPHLPPRSCQARLNIYP